MMGWILALVLYVLGACHTAMIMMQLERLGFDTGSTSWVVLWPLRVALLIITGREDGE